MSYLDLRALAKEYGDLKERAVDPQQDDPLDEEDQERLKALADLEDQLFTTMEEYAENEPIMIPEENFEDYAQEWADGVGYLSGPAEDNPLMSYIDWGRWAADLMNDYTEVTFEGGTYLIRAY